MMDPKWLALVLCSMLVMGLVKGRLIGTLPNEQHQISGNFYIVNSATLFIEDFNYDGGGPGAFLYSYAPGVAVNRFGGGTIIPLPASAGQGSSANFPGAFQRRIYTNEDIMVTLPDGMDACDIGTITIWCQPFSSIFTRLAVPRDTFANDGNDPCTVVGTALSFRTVPDSGSIIAGSVGDQNITIFCEVFIGPNQQLTTWRLQLLGESMSDVITADDPNFAFDGEPVPGFPGITFDTNLTILTLTEDLDGSIFFCGAIGIDEEAANFTIRINPLSQDTCTPQNTINFNSNDIRTLGGGTVCFQCFFGGSLSSDPATTWSFIDGSSVPSEQGEVVDGVLRIFDTTVTFSPTNIVILQCRLGGEQYVLAFQVSAFESPEIEDTMGNPITTVTLNEGDTLDIVCDISNSAPTPVQRWLDPQGNVIISTAGLLIVNIQMDQAGEYTCQVENTDGDTLNSTVTVTVQSSTTAPPTTTPTTAATPTMPALDFTFINNTPILRGDTVTAEFEANRPGLDIMCHLTHLPVPRRNCSSGSFTQTNLPPGDYTVRIVARDIPRGERFIIRSRIWVHADDTFCALYLTNRQVTVDGNNATVEFGSSGVASEFICVLDRMDIFPCQSPVQLTGLQSGRHHFKVIPTDCGREFRPRVVQIPIN